MQPYPHPPPSAPSYVPGPGYMPMPGHTGTHMPTTATTGHVHSTAQNQQHQQYMPAPSPQPQFNPHHHHHQQYSAPVGPMAAQNQQPPAIFQHPPPPASHQPTYQNPQHHHHSPPALPAAAPAASHAPSAHVHGPVPSDSRSNPSSQDRPPVPYLNNVDPDRAKLAAHGDPITSARLTANAQQIAAINSDKSTTNKSKKRGRGNKQPAAACRGPDSKRPRTEASRNGPLDQGQRVLFVKQDDCGHPLRENQVRGGKRNGQFLEFLLHNSPSTLRQQVMSSLDPGQTLNNVPTWQNFAFAKYCRGNSSDQSSHWQFHGFVTSPDTWTLDNLTKVAQIAQPPKLRRIYIIKWRFDETGCAPSTILCEAMAKGQRSRNPADESDHDYDGSWGGDDFEDDVDVVDDRPSESPFSHAPPPGSAAHHHSTSSHPLQLPAHGPPSHPDLAQHQHPHGQQTHYAPSALTPAMDPAQQRLAMYHTQQQHAPPPIHNNGQAGDHQPQQFPSPAQQQSQNGAASGWQQQYALPPGPSNSDPIGNPQQQQQYAPPPPPSNSGPISNQQQQQYAPPPPPPPSGIGPIVDQQQQQYRPPQPYNGVANGWQQQYPPPPAPSNYDQAAFQQSHSSNGLGSMQQQQYAPQPLSEQTTVSSQQQHAYHAAPQNHSAVVKRHQQHNVPAQPGIVAVNIQQQTPLSPPPQPGTDVRVNQKQQYALPPMANAQQHTLPPPPPGHVMGDEQHAQHAPRPPTGTFAGGNHHHDARPPPLGNIVGGDKQQHAQPPLSASEQVAGGGQQKLANPEPPLGRTAVDNQRQQQAPPPFQGNVVQQDRHVPLPPEGNSVGSNQQQDQCTPLLPANYADGITNHDSPPEQQQSVIDNQHQQHYAASLPPQGNPTNGDQNPPPPPPSGKVDGDQQQWPRALPLHDIVVEGDVQKEQHAPPRNQQQAPPREVAHVPVSRLSPDEDNASLPPSKIARELVARQGLELRFGTVLDSRHWSNHDALRTRLQSVEFNAEEVTHHYEMATSSQVRSYLHDHLGSHRQSVSFVMPKYPSKDTEASGGSGALAQLFDSLVWASVRQHLGRIDDLYVVGHQLHGVRGNTVYRLPIVAAHVWSHFRRHLDPSGLPSTATAQAAVIPSTSGKSTSVFADFALFGLMAAICAIGNAPLPYLHPILVQFVSGNYGVLEVVDAAIELGFILELLPVKVGKAYSRLCRVRVSMYPTARDMGHALEAADFELFGERAEQVKDEFISGLRELAAAGMAGPTVRQSVARRYVAFMLHHYLAPLDAFRRGLRLGLQCDHGPTSFRNNLVVALFPTDSFMVTASSIIRQLQQGSASDGLDPIAGWLMLGELRGWLAVAEEYARNLLVMFTTFVFGSYLVPPATEGGVRVAVHVKKKKKSEEAHVSFSTDPPAVTFHVGAATHDWGQLRGEEFHLLMTRSLFERAEKLRSRSKEEASRIDTVSTFAEQLQRQDTLWKDWIPGDSIGYTW